MSTHISCQMHGCCGCDDRCPHNEYLDDEEEEEEEEEIVHVEDVDEGGEEEGGVSQEYEGANEPSDNHVETSPNSSQNPIGGLVAYYVFGSVLEAQARSAAAFEERQRKKREEALLVKECPHCKRRFKEDYHFCWYCERCFECNTSDTPGLSGSESMHWGCYVSHDD